MPCLGYKIGFTVTGDCYQLNLNEISSVSTAGMLIRPRNLQKLTAKSQSRALRHERPASRCPVLSCKPDLPGDPPYVSKVLFPAL